ncbi:MAG: FtsW/RodA/SpoVE family cell cycle protein, partial [Lachnospiraceae bacterium]|nr:FtsW/RodA/SpoVE family cell cycle protein [Lachnospiraceae bacterium]
SAELAAFYGAQAAFFVCYIYLYRVFYRNSSRILVNNTCMLLATSFIILTRLNPDRAMRQFLIVAVSAVASWLVPFIIGRVWQLAKYPFAFGFLGLALLFIVFAAGKSAYGAQLSLSVAGISLQPSEFVKITFVFFVAGMFYRSVSFKTVAQTTAFAAAHVLVLVASRDLGSALIFFIAYLMMLFVATNDWRLLGIGAAGGTGAACIAYRLFPHVQRRVAAWSDPWTDVADTGYQAAQALFAIGTGGWLGAGLYAGMPEKIPVVDKDFVFAAVSEELGGVYALCILFICLGCFLQFMMVAMSLQAMFYKLIAFGLGTVYITQVFLTIGGVVKFIPLTGVTLPFVSYGGSSAMSTFMVFNIIQGLYILKHGEEDADEEKQRAEESETESKG